MQEPMVAKDEAAGERWALVRRYVELEARFERARLACQVMIGFELLELRKFYGITPGRPRLQPVLDAENSNETGVYNSAASAELSEKARKQGLSSGSNCISAEGDKNFSEGQWPRILQAEAGLKERTAEIYMNLARACRPRLKRLHGTDRLRALLDLSPSQWTAEDTELVDAAVRKLTNGRTQMEFMCELGLVCLPPGYRARGTYHPRHEPSSVEEELRVAREIARNDWRQIDRLLDLYGGKFLLLQDDEVQAQCAILETLLQARRKWLAEPAARRRPVSVDEALEKLR
jgi:hypothetical protein